MNDHDFKLTLRVTEHERDEIKKKAALANLSTNEYVRRKLLGDGVDEERQLRSRMMKSLCELENQMRTARTYESLHACVTAWRWKTIQELEA